MDCPKCGQAVEASAEFCGNCGQPLHHQTPTTLITPPTSAVPAYDQPTSGSNKGETRATIGLIIGILGVPGALVPILGLALGVVGLILGTTARKHYKKRLTTLAILFSCLAIVLSLGNWAYVAQHLSKQTKSRSSAKDAASTANLETITTPCYTTAITKGLNPAVTGCKFDTSSPNQEFTVGADSISGLNADNFAARAPSIMKTTIKGDETTGGGTITSQGATSFNGSPAYQAAVSLEGGFYGTFMFVYHPVSHGENLFVLAHVMKDRHNVSLSPLDSTWAWQ